VAQDVLEHLRGLRPQLLPALALSVIVGVVTFLVSSAQAPVFAATGTAWVETGAPAGSDADAATRAELTTAAVALAEDRAVLQEAVRSSGHDWTTADAADRITVAQDPQSGAVSIRVLGPSPQAACEVADEMVQTLDARIGALQSEEVGALVEDLRGQATEIETRLATLPEGSPARSGLEQDLAAVLGQIDDVRRDEPAATLVAVGAASAPDEAIEPRPWGTAATWALVAFILAAEGLALIRHRRPTDRG
jgi:hypothetical protein